MYLKTSIIIPCYNAQKTITKAYVSCLNQLKYYPNIEIILVSDDGYNYEKNLHEMSILDKKITKHIYTEKPKSGPSAARNMGIQSATGEIITFLDADDEINPTRTSITTEFAIKHGIAVDPILIKLNNSYYPNSIKPVSGISHVIDLIAHPVPYGFTILKENINYLFDENLKFAEDSEFKIMNTLSNKGFFYYVNMPLYTYNIYNTNLKKTITSSSSHNIVRKSYETISKRIINHPDTPDKLKEIVGEIFSKKIKTDYNFNQHSKLESLSFFEYISFAPEFIT